MNLSDTIAIIITGPFFFTVTDRGVGTDDMIVALPFIGVNHDPNLSEGVDVVFQGLLVGMMHYSQAYLSTVTAYGANDRGAVIIVSAMPLLFIGPTAGRIIWVAVIVTFFPPRSETSRQFQSVCLLSGFEVDPVGHWLVSPGVLREPFAD